MSVRAYAIKKLVTEEDSTFNLWSDEGQEILDLVPHTENFDGEGFISFAVEDVKTALREANGEVKDILKQMIKDARRNEFVEYMCF